MKINNNYTNFLQSLKQTQNKISAKKEETKTNGTNKKSVEINFSEEAKRLSKISENEGHTQKVEEIKNAIQNKTYEVDPKAIANSMIDTIKNQRGIES